MSWLCRCQGIVWEPMRTRAQTQLVREHSVTVVSAYWATVDWSWHKSGISVRELILTLKKKHRGWGMNCRTFSKNFRTRGKSHHPSVSPRGLTFTWWECYVYVKDINQPSLPTPCYFVFVSFSFFMALSTVFHSINSPGNSPFLSLGSSGLISLPY